MTEEQTKRINDLAFRVGVLRGTLEGDLIECHILYMGGQLKEKFTHKDLINLKELLGKLSGIFYLDN